MRLAHRYDLRSGASPDVAAACGANQAMNLQAFENQTPLWASQTTGVKLNPAASATNSVSLYLRLNCRHGKQPLEPVGPQSGGTARKPQLSRAAQQAVKHAGFIVALPTGKQNMRVPRIG